MVLRRGAASVTWMARLTVMEADRVAAKKSPHSVYVLPLAPDMKDRESTFVPIVTGCGATPAAGLRLTSPAMMPSNDIRPALEATTVDGVMVPAPTPKSTMP